MKYGICTTDFEPAPIDHLFAKISGMGYECVQFNFAAAAEYGYEPTGEDELPDKVDYAVIDRVNDSKAKYGLSITAVNATWNMSHPDAAVRREGLRRLELACDMARRLDCELLSICTGTRCREYLWRYDAANTTAEAWAVMLASVKEAAHIAEDKGVRLGIETEASNVVRTPELSGRVLEEVASPALGMILDGANLFLPGEAKREKVQSVLDRAFAAFGDRILLVHGKDIAEGSGIDFRATGEGIVDFAYMKELLDKSGYEGNMVLHGIYDEAKMKPCLDYIRNLWN